MLDPLTELAGRVTLTVWEPSSFVVTVAASFELVVAVVVVSLLVESA